jgi:ribosomal protein S18 acetylase RimI-like enzyme
MPQDTLLDFFKSQTPGPFGSAAASTEASLNEDELEVREKSHSMQRPTRATRSTKPLATGLESRQTSGPTDAKAANASGPNTESQLPGLMIVGVQPDHLPALKRLTGNLLPVKYPGKFFDGAVSEEIPAKFSRVALIDGKPVGWIRCRLDPFPEPTVPPSKTKPIYNRIYVQALCVLAPYRGLGVATSLLGAVTASPLPANHDVAHVYAHVWESNEEALEWYDMRGFDRIMKVEQYYRKLRPGGAWIVKKDLDST